MEKVSKVDVLAEIEDVIRNMPPREELHFHNPEGQGLVFDYFDGIRKQIELAKTELFFVDPYLDSDFVSRYLPQVDLA
jgi:hypothetical protein